MFFVYFSCQRVILASNREAVRGSGLDNHYKPILFTEIVRLNQTGDVCDERRLRVSKRKYNETASPTEIPDHACRRSHGDVS